MKGINMKCVQCDSINIVRNVQILDLGPGGFRNLKAGVEKRPKAMIFKDMRAVDIHGNVCVECGFVMLSVSKGGAQRLRNDKSTAEKI